MKVLALISSATHPTSKVLYNNYGSQETEAGKYEERDRISVEFHPHI